MEYPNWLKKRAYESGDTPALFFQNKQETFKEVYEHVLLLAGKLVKMGVKEGMRVGLLGKNDRETFLFIHALMQIGAPIVFLNNRLTVNEMSYQLNDSSADRLLYAPHFKDQVKKLTGKKSSYTDVFIQAPHKFTPRPTWPSSRVATIMYTSGTTGKAKGVLQSHRNHFYSALCAALYLGTFTKKDRWLCVVPIFHISGLSILMRSMIYGASIYLEERFQEEKLANFLKSGTITHVSLVATMLKRLLDISESACHKNVKAILLGGSSIPKSLIKEGLRRHYPLIPSFGMTETASQVVALPCEYAKSKIGSSGRALPPVKLRIVAHEKVASANEIGEIEIKAPNVMPGYLNNPEATRKAFRQGYFKTGDMGYLDEEGFLFVVGRRQDLIISGGENIYPTEIENVLLTHPDIQEVAVVGKEDSIWGEVPIAYFTASRFLAEQEIIEHVSSRLAKFKIPKKWVQVPDLPKTATGKIKRHLVKNTLPKKRS